MHGTCKIQYKDFRYALCYSLSGKRIGVYILAAVDAAIAFSGSRLEFCVVADCLHIVRKVYLYLFPLTGGEFQHSFSAVFLIEALFQYLHCIFKHLNIRSSISHKYTSIYQHFHVMHEEMQLIISLIYMPMAEIPGFVV